MLSTFPVDKCVGKYGVDRLSLPPVSLFCHRPIFNHIIFINEINNLEIFFWYRIVSTTTPSQRGLREPRSRRDTISAREPTYGSPHQHAGKVHRLRQFRAGLQPDSQRLGAGPQRPAALVSSCRPRFRSEERRVGKECRSRWSPYH